MIGRPSFELAAGTHTISKRSGVLTFFSVVGAAADVTISFYDVNAEADIATTNKIAAFKLDVSLAGMDLQSTGIDLKYTLGLVCVLAGAGAVAYVGHKKG